ncbi:MCE-family protein MCE1c [Mycolicibacterium fortuitum]|uniref:MCE-family protein MCE1c n=1 Tax=Mycolicibacterium fortuitum TaxID=1766 RepID=A0A378UZI6_MYCFO|nr:MCE-family protein MCE1c [Mycolicibacterium fortuitum]
MLPLGQTTTPYQIYDAFLDVTRNASGWDTKSVKESLNVLSETVDQTSPHLSAALDGVARFSETIGKRDEDVKKLLANANKVATILGDRSTQVNQLLVNAQTLLAAVNERGQAVSMLLERVSSVSNQVEGLINDNPNLNHVLEQLRTVSDLLVERKQDLADTLTVAGKFITSLAEALASGPYFKVMLVNLIPPQILQPFVDSAFKKRGIDPEEFWRNAGLPSARFPDPNGKRFENGAPPPAPTPLEGTPEHPGPAVPPGSPCSYTPTAAGIPSPGNPMPCAAATQGPFGGPSTVRRTWLPRRRILTASPIRRGCPVRLSPARCRRISPVPRSNWRPVRPAPAPFRSPRCRCRQGTSRVMHRTRRR